MAGLQLLAVLALTLLVAAGLFGNPATFKNITPVAVWVIWWVGFGFLTAFVGNIWPLINPWSSTYGFVEMLTRPWTNGLSFHLNYPRWLGVWPSCGLFLLFAWLELVAPGRDVPRNIAIAILIYSAFTWTGFAIFGRDTWLKRGEVFSLLSACSDDLRRWILPMMAAGASVFVHSPPGCCRARRSTRQ